MYNYLDDYLFLNNVLWIEEFLFWWKLGFFLSSIFDFVEGLLVVRFRGLFWYLDFRDNLLFLKFNGEFGEIVIMSFVVGIDIVWRFFWSIVDDNIGLDGKILWGDM